MLCVLRARRTLLGWIKKEVLHTMPSENEVPNPGKKKRTHKNRFMTIVSAVPGKIFKFLLILILIGFGLYIGLGEYDVWKQKRIVDNEYAARTAADKANKAPAGTLEKPSEAPASNGAPNQGPPSTKPADSPAPALTFTQADVDRMLAAKEAEIKANAQKVELESEKDKELRDLRAQRDQAFAGAKQQGEEAVSKEREALVKEREASFAGQASVKWEQFDEDKHVVNNKDKVRPGERKFKVKDALPKFRVGSKPESPRGKKSEDATEIDVFKDVYPVLAPDGGKLLLDKTPELENSDRVPFPLWTDGPLGLKQTWWVDGPPSNNPG